MSLSQNWVSVLLPTEVFVGIVDRVEFDRLALPVKDYGSDPRRPVLTKTMTAEGVTVVFQHWYGKTEAEIAADRAVEAMRGQSLADAYERTRKALAGVSA